MKRTQDRVLYFIREYIRETGHAPTMQEIADGVGVVKSTVRFHLRNLRDAGFIRYEDGKPRTIVICQKS